MTNHKKYYKPNSFALKAKRERTRTVGRVKIRPGWRDQLAHQIGALGSPGRFMVAGSHQRVGMRHFSV